MKLLFLAVLVLVAAALQWWTGRRCLAHLTASLEPSAVLVEPGERFDLVLRFTNRSRLFLPFLRYRLRVPDEFSIHLDGSHIEYGHLGKFAGQQYITGTAWLGPRQQLEKRFPVSCAKRGYYTLGELTLYGGDFLGLNEQPRSFSRLREVVVYPQAAPRQDVAQVFGGFLGELSVQRFLQEDPVLTIGFREYTGREPMKTISWTQSARRGELMVKKFDYTLEPTATVLLNIENAADESAEQCFSLARSVCEELEDKGVKYDFRMNAVTRGSVRGAEYFPEGLGRSHFLGILEQLGRAVCLTRRPCSAMLSAASADAVSSRGIILITPERTPETVAAARRFADSTGGVLLILTAKEGAPC